MKIDEKKLELELARKCMSISDLTRASNISRTTIYQILDGRSTGTAVAGKIAKAMGVDILDIIKWKKI